MTEFKPAERLEVFRRLSTGHRVLVGKQLDETYAANKGLMAS